MMLVGEVTVSDLSGLISISWWMISKPPTLFYCLLDRVGSQVEPNGKITANLKIVMMITSVQQ